MNAEYEYWILIPKYSNQILFYVEYLFISKLDSIFPI